MGTLGPRSTRYDLDPSAAGTAMVEEDVMRWHVAAITRGAPAAARRRARAGTCHGEDIPSGCICRISGSEAAATALRQFIVPRNGGLPTAPPPARHGDDLHLRHPGEIRGRVGKAVQPPGPTSSPSRAGEASARRIRGHDAVPGPELSTGDVVRARLEARLAARNSHLQQSLADHGERVAKRRRCEDVPPRASAASRLAALRERVAMRTSGAAPSTALHGDARRAAGHSADAEHAAERVALHGVPAAPAGEVRQLSA